MTIDDYELTCKEVFVSIDGYVMLSPVYFLCQSLEAHGNCEAIREVDKEYVKYPLSASKSVGNGRHDNKCVDARQLSDLRIIFLEIFQYIDRACEKEIIQLYRLL